MTAVEGAYRCTSSASRQITYWWQEAEEAARSGQLARARRFLRWIVACCPEEEEGWLQLAHLTAASQEQIPILKSAYRFHPESQRIQVALREARQRQMESAVGELKPRGAIPHCLPGERQVVRRHDAKAGNGRGPKPKPEPQPHPLEAMIAGWSWPFASLFKLRQREPAANNKDGNRENAQTPSSRLDVPSY